MKSLYYTLEIEDFKFFSLEEHLEEEDGTSASLPGR